MNSERRHPALDFITVEPYKTVQLYAWNSSLPGPGEKFIYESGGSPAHINDLTCRAGTSTLDQC